MAGHYLPYHRHHETDELLEQVLERLEAVRGPDAAGWYTTRCPRPENHQHADRSPSFRVGPRGFKCMVPTCPLSRGGSLRELAEELGLGVSRNGHRRPGAGPTPDPLAWWASWCGVPREWLRRLPLEASDGAVAFRWRGLETRKLRAPDRKGWWTPEDAPRPDLWPALPDPAPGVLVVCEGESDVLCAWYALDRAGLLDRACAVAVTKGASSRPDPALLRELRSRGVAAVLVVPDADSAGEAFGQAWQAAAREAGLNAATLDLVAAGLVRPSLGCKDLRDAWHHAPHRVVEVLTGKLEEVSICLPTIGNAVGRQLAPASAADLLATPAAGSLETLPFLGHPGVVIRGWSHILVGPPKAGKTELLWSCVRAWDASGVRVLWVTEESEAVWAQRLRRDRAQPVHVRWLLAAGRQREDILQALRRYASGFDVAVVDTLRHVFRVDELDNAAIAEAIAALDDAIGRDRTRIYLHHTRKAPGEHGERTAGGFAFVGAVDRQLEISWDPHHEDRRLLRGVSRIVPVHELLLGWQDGQLVVLGAPEAVELEQVCTRVLAVLSEEWRLTREVLAALGEPRPSDEQVRKALLRLAREGLVERDPPLDQGEVPRKPHRWRLASQAPLPTASFYSWQAGPAALPPPREVAPVPEEVVLRRRQQGLCEGCGGPVVVLGGRRVCSRCGWRGPVLDPAPQPGPGETGPDPAGVSFLSRSLSIGDRNEKSSASPGQVRLALPPPVPEVPCA